MVIEIEHSNYWALIVSELWTP